ncbi:hypothetical protein ACJX0J_026769, partial [Zea mays]
MLDMVNMLYSLSIEILGGSLKRSWQWRRTLQCFLCAIFFLFLAGPEEEKQLKEKLRLDHV